MTTGDWIIMAGLWAAFVALVLWTVSRLLPRPCRPVASERIDEPLPAGAPRGAHGHVNDQFAGSGGLV